MPVYQVTIRAFVFLMAVSSWQAASWAEVEPPAAAAESETPRAVVARWLELHRTGQRAAALALTTESRHHRALYFLSSKRDTGVRVARSLGSERVAAVITTSLEDAGASDRVLLFWLVRRDGVWRINKSDATDSRIVDERLRGFLESGDVHWHVRRGALLGHWEAGPGTAPGGGGIACGSEFQLNADNRYRLESWGPGGPHPEYNDVLQGTWQLTDDRIVLSHQDQIHECRVTWMTDDLLVVESLDGSAEYERTGTLPRSGVAE